MKKSAHGLGSIFAIPLMLGLVCAVGLVTALLGDGAWDLIAWLGLGLPCLLGVHALARR